MCGLLGLLAGCQPQRRLKDIEALADLFTTLLLLSEHRGPHATGVAWVKRNGRMEVAKAPLPARQFVQSSAYLDWLLGVGQAITYLMGHTRWPSRGSVANPANNHPLVVPIRQVGPMTGGNPRTTDLAQRAYLALSHNGTLLNVSRQFSRLGLPRTAEVDSELLIRLAQRHTGDGGLDVGAFLDALTPLEGSMSAALVATNRPDEVVLMKGNMPLEVRRHRHRRLVVYASEVGILDKALGGEAGWEEVPLVPGEALVIETTEIETPRRLPFTFQGQAGTARWQHSTGV